MKPHVIDANVMNQFQKERLADDCSGIATTAIRSITNDNCIVIDDSGPCAQEWLDCAGGSYPLALQDWINDMLIEQKLRLSPMCTDSMYNELSKIGMPKKDHKWVRLALGSGSSAIVSDDIDFFDPSKKKSSSEVMRAIKENCEGPVAKYLRKKYGIRPMCPSKVSDFVSTYAEQALSL